jgi:glycosyltransferase involved in cell wall biosynthesis
LNRQKIGLYVGSLIGRKGIDLLFDAIEKSTSDFKIWLVGSGSNEAEYRQRVAGSERLAKTIVFKGYKEGEALMECYRQADFFVFPTREDCFALVLLEAAAAGLPILSSTYADGAYEILEEGVNGYMADPFDAEAFGKKIDEIVGNGDLAKTTISFNRDMLKKFTFEEVAKGYVEAVESALRYMLH